jgi:hypothetical protein
MNVSSGKIIVLKVASVFGGEAKRNRIQRDLAVLFDALIDDYLPRVSLAVLDTKSLAFCAHC